MNQMKISDITMKQTGKDFTLSFKEKLELPKLLDRLNVSVIELEGISQPKVDALRIKSIAATIKNSTIAVPVELSKESVEQTWNALKEAKSPRLQVVAPVSAVQMEYLYHKKPAAMLEAVKETIRECCSLTQDVEFVAEDATRSDEAFLYEIITEAVNSGAGTITVCDATGSMLPEEFCTFIDKLYDNVEALKNVTLGISCCNDLAMADSCAVAAIKHGVREIKATAYQLDKISLPNISRLIATRGDSLGVTSSVRTVEMNRVVRQITWMCQTNRSKNSPFDNGVDDVKEDVSLTSADNMETVFRSVERLGYDLSDEDKEAVWEAFKKIAERKEDISSKELDTIIASVAMQVPATYTLNNYTITANNNSTSVAHMVLEKDGQKLEGVAIGDGPVDAAFLAIENILGCHYEVDDFQVRSVTEGREAMGETLIKLRSNSKLSSGHGISTDIVGSSIQAYISALNKIVYEEAGV